MKAQEILSQAHDSMTVKRVFGEPFEKDGVTLVPAAKIWGGAGSGEGDDKGHGPGAGYGLREKPAGAFVIKSGKVRWVPSVDVNRIILGGQMVMAAAILAAALRRRGRSHAAA